MGPTVPGSAYNTIRTMEVLQRQVRPVAPRLAVRWGAGTALDHLSRPSTAPEARDDSPHDTLRVGRPTNGGPEAAVPDGHCPTDA